MVRPSCAALLLLAGCYQSGSGAQAPDGPSLADVVAADSIAADGAEPDGAEADASDDALGCQARYDCEAVVVDGICFQVCGNGVPKVFVAARIQCQSFGGCLARVTPAQSAAIATFMRADSAGPEVALIGLRQFTSGTDAGPADAWDWTCDGTSLDPSDAVWATGDPNDLNGAEDCVQLNQYFEAWQDILCSDEKPYLCRIP